MRRPVKPFVTEYRGGARRAASQGAAPGLDPFKSESPLQGAPAWTPPAQSEPQEDGYEAALRAADALFSGGRPAASADAQAHAPALDSEPPKSTAPVTGRILRVLDEPPTADMLEMERLEAEHAPKKRGRKPGSKNKPKVAALQELPGTPAPSAPPSEAPAIPAATVTAALAARAVATAPRRAEAAVPGERYAWVRTRLKPGQQWKRRLPKVAW